MTGFRERRQEVESALDAALRAYAVITDTANVAKFVSEARDAIDEVLDGFGTVTDALEETPLARFIFTPSVRHDDGEYLDIDLTEKEPKGILRNWILSIPRSNPSESSGLLQRSETENDGFDYDVPLGRKMTRALAMQVIAHKGDLNEEQRGTVAVAAEVLRNKGGA